ncbi:MAG: sensor histidine kinase [Actinomycetota bacterium]
MHNGSPVIRRVGQLVTAETADPRLPQLVFLAPIAALLVLVALVQPATLAAPAFAAGAAMVALATVAAFTVPWTRLEPLAVVTVPLLDLAAIGSMRLLPNIGAVAALVVFPAMWLGLVFRRRGVVIATVGCIAVLTAPGLLYYGLGLDGWSRAVLLPIITGVVALSTSITAEVWDTQRQGLERQGAELQELLREVTQHRRLTDAIVEAVDVGLLALGADGAYNSMNPRHQEFIRLAYPDGHGGMAGELGYAFGEDRVTPLSEDQMPSVRAASGEAFSDLVMWIGKEPAQRRALSVSARPFYDETGRFDGSVLTYKDITDLMRALQVKDEFVASVSHELRTPLTSILGYADLMAEQHEELPSEVNHYLRVVHRNAERLLLLVSDLLSTAQLESGTLRMNPEPTDLSDVVRHAVEAVRRKADAGAVKLHASIQQIPDVVVDPARMGQVVDNLVSNAVKYTLSGGEVAVWFAVEGDEVVLEVRDTGIGIPEEDLAKLYTRFFRARTAEERAIPGVGLGLVITRAIVEAHGGAIELQSAEGVGTTARVRLPFVPD